MKAFDKNNTNLTHQFDNINWIENSGMSEEELKDYLDTERDYCKKI